MKSMIAIMMWLVLQAAGAALGQTEFGLGNDPDQPADRQETPPVANGQAIRPVFGFGISMSSEIRQKGEEDPFGVGIYLEVDRVWRANRAIQPMAYAGAVFTWPDDDSCAHPDNSCNVSASTAFVGGKVRLMVPIPWVAPFIEAGFGMSAGRITTMDGGTDDRQDSGLMMHVPFSLGLAMGKNHAYTFVFTYLAYPNKNHLDGAVAVGFDIPLN